MRISKAYKQILAFLGVGVICYLISIILLMALVELLKVEINLSNLIASVITIIICYYLNVILVFQAGKYSKLKEFMAFFTFSLLGLSLNVGLMYLLTEFTEIWYVLSKTFVTAVVAIFNFTTRKIIVFQG